MKAASAFGRLVVAAFLVYNVGWRRSEWEAEAGRTADAAAGGAQS